MRGIFVEVKKEEKKEFYTIDILEILKNVFYRLWLVILCGVIGGCVGFVYARFYISPTYSSSAMLYVNGTSISLGGQKLTVSSSDISMARSLVDTYVVILNNRTTLEAVAEESGLNYTAGQLSGMISAAAVGETEVIKVTVVSRNPYEAAKIANAVTVVLPKRISMIISGASMEVVDTAVPNTWRIAPNTSKYTALGFGAGLAFAVFVIAILTILDNTIHDTDYVRTTYNLPSLARIPDLRTANITNYGYSSYGYKHKYGYGYGYGYGKEQENADGKDLENNDTEDKNSGKE